MNGDVYITRNWRRKWVIRIEGQHDRQMDAEQEAIVIAHDIGPEYTRRRRDGTIGLKNTYRKDPPESPG